MSTETHTTNEERYLAALAQAVFDSDTHPDGPMLGKRFWDLLDEMEIAEEVRRRAAALES